MAKPSAASLRRVALAFEAVTEGVACEGTALERRTVKVGSKVFVFIGKTEVMLKLGASLTEAKKVAAGQPDVCRVGSGGWVKLTLGGKGELTQELLNRWIRESYALAKTAKTRPTKATPPRR